MPDSAGVPEANLRDRRKHWRLQASYRVEYDVDGRRCTSFTANLSQGGMLLRSASDLTSEEEREFLDRLRFSGSAAEVLREMEKVQADGTPATSLQVNVRQKIQRRIKRLQRAS